MEKLETIFTSNIPVDCHILKGRLETEGIRCFLFDENMIWVYPFRAVAIGGVKLKIPHDQCVKATNIMKLLEMQKLTDEKGDYELSEQFRNDFDKHCEVLKIKSELRKNPALIAAPDEIKPETLSQEEWEVLLASEAEFRRLNNKKLDFSWKEFLYELFDFDRSIFTYLRTRPVQFYLEKDLVDKFPSESHEDDKMHCPNCRSDNVKYGYAIDYQWDILYLILSFLTAPFPLIRKKMHCFNCGYNFKREKSRGKK